jgi:Protein of unknown function (DUF2809)
MANLQSNRRGVAFFLLIGTTLLGLIWWMAPLHLSFFLWKYGGSALWAADVYWLTVLLFVQLPPGKVAASAGLIAFAVEFSRLIESPGLEAFRSTLAGRLLLGRLFSPRNILAYWLAVAAAYLLDRYTGILPPRRLP